MRRFLLVVLVFVAGLSATAARAQDAATQARALFEQGLAQMDANHFAEAASAFERSLALRESSTARYNLALAYRGAHQTRKAIATLRVLLASPAQSAQAMLDDAARILSEAERALVRITLHVNGAPAEITVDGEQAAPRVDQPLELDPGRHVFVAHAAGRAPVTVEQTFRDGARGAVTIDLARGGEVPAHLEVRASIADATISIDGEDAHTHGMFVGELPAGTHTIRISAAGFATETHDVELDPGARRVLQITLSPGPAGQDTSVTSQWWFWTLLGVGAVAIGVTIAVIVATTSGPQFVERPPVLGDDGRTITTLTFP